MAHSCAKLTRAEHPARHDGAYLGYLSPRAVLKYFDRAKVEGSKVPTTTPYMYSCLLHARTIINNVVRLKQGYANLK